MMLAGRPGMRQSLEQASSEHEEALLRKGTRGSDNGDSTFDFRWRRHGHALLVAGMCVFEHKRRLRQSAAPPQLLSVLCRQ